MSINSDIHCQKPHHGGNKLRQQLLSVFVVRNSGGTEVVSILVDLALKKTGNHVGNSFKLKNYTQISIRSRSLWCAHSSRLKPQISLAKGWLLSWLCSEYESCFQHPHPRYCLLRVAPDRTFHITWEGAWSNEGVWEGDSSRNSVLPGHSVFHLVYSLGLERFEGSIRIFYWY